MSLAVTDFNDRMLCLEQGQLVPPKKPRYRIVGELGEGAFSRVWLARDTQVKERSYVAIKVDGASKSSSPSSETLVLRKLRSHQKSSKHPGAATNIYLIDDFVMQAPGRAGWYHSCIVTEVIISLGDRWLDMQNRCMLMQPLVNAVAFLHDHGIVHGDPHENNVGVVVEGLNKISEATLIPLFEEDQSWLCILYEIGLPPTDAAHSRLRLYDFGRAYETSAVNGETKSVLPGNNPNCPPEVYMYRLSRKSIGVEWSFACDVWALACTINETCRAHMLAIPPCNGTDLNWGIMTRCSPGGPPPAEWLEHCSFGPYLLERFKIFKPWKPPIMLVENPKSKAAIMKGLEVMTERFWTLESQRQPHDPATLPIDSFSDMIKGMMATNPDNRSTMKQVIQHPFWRQLAKEYKVENDGH